MFERPHGLLATSTHDTKRGEDVRARINVLSEIPAKWRRAVCRWKEINHDRKTLLAGEEVPDANVEYLLYQTLVGAWPLEPMDEATYSEFVCRAQEYLIKAMREAKVHTSWISPNEDYERATREFIEAILKLEKTNRFLRSFAEFHAPIARAGMYNSLAQDGRIKLYLTSRALRFRRERQALFAEGCYLSLAARGQKENHVIAFARALANQTAVVVTGRFFTRLGDVDQSPTGSDVWGDSAVTLNYTPAAGWYRDVFTGHRIRAEHNGVGVELSLAKVFAHLPVALLERGKE